MSYAARVVWSEGMFLRTQHFQQQDRWVDGLVRGATQGLRSNGWGFRELELEPGLLTQGKLALRRAEGVMPDGTPFSIPAEAQHPEPIEFGATAAQTVVHLVLPVQQAGAVEIDPVGGSGTGARHLAREIELRDALADAEGTAPVHLAELRFRFVPDQAQRDAYVGLPVARVVAVQTDGSILLDPEFPVPALRLGACAYFTAFVDELVGKIESIAEERAAFVAGKRAQGSGDLADFLILQLCNRYLAGARHLEAQRSAHPEDLYRWLLELLGEASTFTTGQLVPPALEPYRHAEPWLAYRPLVAEVRRVLLELARPDRKAIQIPLRLFPSGVRAAEVQDRTLFTEAAFFIAVQAPVAPEAIRQRLPGQIKIGPAEELQSIVRSAVPGIPIRHLPTVPREIPVRRDMVYFELDRHNDFWRRLPQSAGLGIHVTGDLREGMDMECWAIRS